MRSWIVRTKQRVITLPSQPVSGGGGSPPPSYTFSGFANDPGSTGNSSIIGVNVGPNVGASIVVSTWVQNGGIATSGTNASVVVGGTTLTFLGADSTNTNIALWYGTLSGTASGTQTLNFTLPGSAFNLRTYGLWYTNSALTLDQSQVGGTSVSIDVPNNGWIFGTSFRFNVAPPSFSSTPSPSNQNSINPASNYQMTDADWTGVSVNPSFSISSSGTVVAASFTHSP